MQVPIYISNILVFTLMLFSSCSWAVSKHEADERGVAFRWRSIYSPTSAEMAKKAPKTTHHVDYTWGLWGHNLKKAFVDYRGDDIFAEVDGRREKSQYCFSSPNTFNCIESYIIDQFGEGSSSYHERICIIPNDNKIVCQCAQCRKKGCTKNSATPSVASLVLRLAKRFPAHQFFLAGYSTTNEAPAMKMPDNVGVILSAIDIPMRYEFSQSNGFMTFDSRLTEWKKAVSTLYVWEYSRNYDDYLTPYPCLSIMQKRFQYYRDKGISGIFINGSGYDYSSFDDIQTEVLDKLMEDPDQDVDMLITDAINDRYPATASEIALLYLTMEKKVREKNIYLPYYGTVEDELGYIDPKSFNSEWKELDRKSKSVDKSERIRLSQLLTALSFTRMELTRVTGDTSEFDDILEVLSGFSETHNMINYRETNGSISYYVEDCKKLHRAPKISERR